MPVTLAEGNLHGIGDLVGFGLPGSQPKCRDLVAGVEREGFPVRIAA